MRTSLLLSGLFFGVLFLSPTESQAQWQPDVRLTNDTATSFASSIAASGNVLHVVWTDDRDGIDDEIYYKRSTDSGVSWGADTRLTNNSADSDKPSVTVSGSVVYIVWYDLRDGNPEIYCKRSTDGGISWGADTRLTNDIADSWDPSLTVSGSVVHVVWYDLRDGNDEIYYKRSTDAGISWGADSRLTNDSAWSRKSSVTVSGSVVHVVWVDTRDGNPEIYYKRSTDGGVSWGTDTRLTNNPAASYSSSVTVSGSLVHVVWYDSRDGSWEIYYNRSTDGGLSWGTDIRLTTNPAFSAFPSVTASGSIVHVVWYDERDGNGWEEIYYNRSTDGGASWGADTRLTNNFAWSQFASVTVSDSVVHVVWTDDRNGNYEIYYKRDQTGNPLGIKNISSEFPEDFMLEQNYPNPFNPSSAVTFQIPHSSHVVLKVYDVLGNKVTTLVDEHLTPGRYETTFVGAHLSSGVYFYRLQADGFVQTKKLVLQK